MEPQTIIPLFVILASLQYVDKRRCEVIDNGDGSYRAIIFDAAIGLKISFNQKQDKIVVKSGNYFNEFFMCDDVNLGLIDKDGWMSFFPNESEITIYSSSLPTVFAQQYPDVFILK